MKFDKDGKFLMAWGERGEAGGKEKRPNYFNTVHGIAIDNQRRLYINDRSNRRIQIFDENGKFLNSVVSRRRTDRNVSHLHDRGPAPLGV